MEKTAYQEFASKHKPAGAFIITRDGLAIPIYDVVDHFGNTLEGNNLLSKFGRYSNEYLEAEAKWQAERRKGKSVPEEARQVSIPKEDPVCINCEHFHTHYVKDGDFAMLSHLGHCGYPRIKMRTASATCKHFTSQQA